MTDDDMNIKIDRVVLGKGREIIAENARLRALLRELVEGQNRPGHWCTYCGEYQAGTYSSHDGHGVIIKHTGDCPVRMAREAVGDEG